jgi:hypothetical protein
MFAQALTGPSLIAPGQANQDHGIPDLHAKPADRL